MKKKLHRKNGRIVSASVTLGRKEKAIYKEGWDAREADEVSRMVARECQTFADKHGVSVELFAPASEGSYTVNVFLPK